MPENGPENGKMSELHNRAQLLERLTVVIGAYGADQARWPAADRPRLRALLASDREAQRLLSEATAMDQLLTLADQDDQLSDNAMGRLSNRIMSQLDPCNAHSDMTHFDTSQTDAIRFGPLEQPESSIDTNVISFPVQQLQRQKEAPGSVDNAQTRDWSLWASRAALAASLAIGIFVGANGYLEQTTQSMTALAGIDFTLEPGALIDDGFGGPEEEFL